MSPRNDRLSVMTLQPGECVSRVEPIEDYLADLEFISSTHLRRFTRTGLVAAQYRDSVATTGPMMGEALHSLVLEPERFRARYLVLDDARLGQTGISEEDVMRREWLDAWQWSSLKHARDALLKCDRLPVAQWLESGRKELSIYWRDVAGHRWKARPDCFTPDIVLELKTTSDCRPGPFARARERFGYDLQAAHYIDAVARLTGHVPSLLFVAIELAPPYSVWIHERRQQDMKAAHDELARIKAAYIEALRQR